MVFNNTKKRLQHAFASKVTDVGEATTDSSGIIEIDGLTAGGFVLVTFAEDPGAALVLSDVEVESGRFTVYTKNTGTNARAVVASKKIFYLLLKK